MDEYQVINSMSDNPEIPESEPIGGEVKPQANSQQSEIESPLKLTPEQEQILDEKREEILSGDRVLVRFMNSVEHLEVITNGQVQRPNYEANEVSLQDHILRRVAEARSPHKIGQLSRTWAADAHLFTQWATPSDFIAFFMVSGGQFGTFDKTILEYYKEIRQKSDSVVQAKEQFGQCLKELASEYVDSVLHRPAKSLEETKDALSNPIIGLNEEHRIRLRELMGKDPKGYTALDRKFLIRFAKQDILGRSHQGMFPYEVLQIWSSGSRGEMSLQGYSTVAKDTQTEKLLGVIVLAPDREFCDELTRAMVQTSKDDPKRAHIIIDIRGIEYFPRQGTDFAKKKSKNK